MKKLMSVAIVAQLALSPVVSLAQVAPPPTAPYRGGMVGVGGAPAMAPIGGGGVMAGQRPIFMPGPPPRPMPPMHGGGGGGGGGALLAGLAIGGILGFVIGNMTSNQQGVYNNAFNGCMNNMQCGQNNRVMLPPENGVQSGTYIEIQEGERLRVAGVPNARCRSYNEVLVNNGRPQQSVAKVACLNNQGQWVAAPPEFAGRFQRYDDWNQRDWRSAPALVQQDPAYQPYQQQPVVMPQAQPMMVRRGPPSYVPNYTYGGRPAVGGGNVIVLNNGAPGGVMNGGINGAPATAPIRGGVVGGGVVTTQQQISPPPTAPYRGGVIR